MSAPLDLTGKVALVTGGSRGLDRIDVLVNNAGMSPLYPSLPELTEELWHKVMAVNLMGPLRLSALVGERMKQAGVLGRISDHRRDDRREGSTARADAGRAPRAIGDALHEMTLKLF